MAKKSKKTIVRDPQKGFIVKKVAEMHGVSTDYIYKILNGDRWNEEIFATYMDMLEGSNALVEEVKKLIPLN